MSAKAICQRDQARMRVTRHACVAHSGRRDEPHDALLPPPQPRLLAAPPPAQLQGAARAAWGSQALTIRVPAMGRPLFCKGPPHTDTF